MQEYQCHAYHQDLPKGKASGKVLVNGDGLEFVIREQTIRVPFAGMQVELGGASDRILFFRHAHAPGWTFFSNDRSIIKNTHLQKHPELIQQIQKIRTKRSKHFVAIAAVIAIVVGVPALVIFRMDWVSKQVAREVPVEWEEKLGKSTIDQYSLQNEFLEKEQAEALLEPLVQPLLDELHDSRYQYRFHIALEPTLNAFAAPGGYVVIHSQLILEADSAEELLGVVAHEITHVEEQHGIRNVIGTIGLYTVIGALFGDVGGIAATIANAAPFIINQSYSREFERESDKMGFQLLIDANIDPRGMARFFEKLIAKEKEQMANIEDEQTRDTVKKALEFLSTHPASEERVAYLDKLAEDIPTSYRNLDYEFLELQEAVKAFVLETEESDSQESLDNQEGSSHEN